MSQAPQARQQARGQSSQQLPDWYVPEAQENLAAPAGPLPDWYTPEPETVTSTAEAPHGMAGDMLANAATGVARV
jgi:hypothetical protein